MRVFTGLFVALSLAVAPACNGNIGDLFSIFPASAFQPDEPDNGDLPGGGGGLTAEEVAFLASAQGLDGNIRNLAIADLAGRKIAFVTAGEIGFHIVDVTDPSGLNSTDLLATIDDSVLPDAAASIAGGRVDNVGIVDNIYLVCIAVGSGADNAVTVFHIPTLLTLISSSPTDVSGAFVPGTGDIAVDGTPLGNGGGVDGASGFFLVASGGAELGVGLITGIDAWSVIATVTSAAPNIDNFLDVEMAFPVAHATVADGDDVRLATLTISIAPPGVTVGPELLTLTGSFSALDSNNGSAPGTFVARPLLQGSGATGSLYASGLNDVRVFSVVAPATPVLSSSVFSAGISIGGLAAAPNALATGDGGTLRFFGIFQDIATPIATLDTAGRRYFDLEYSILPAGTFVIACADTNGLRVIQLGDFSSP